MKRFLIALLIVFVGAFANVATYAVNNCTGATYYDSDSDTCIACPAGYDYNTDAGKTDITQCQIHCDAGTYVAVPGIVGYTRLEYIESTGTQYIDTGVRAVDSTITEVDFKLNELGASVFGVLKSNGSNYYGLATTSNQWRLWYGSGGAPWVLGGTPDLDRHVAKIENKTLFLDGVSTLTSTLSTTSNINMYLFGANFEGSFYQPANARIYSAKIWSSGTLVRNMIPARRNSDGVVGMYDTVNNVFYTNAGTGTFVAGSDIGGWCANVGAGYWAAESVVNYGSAGTRNACPAGTSTNGIDNASACTPCAGATYSDAPAAAVCTACPAGYDYNIDAGKTDITQCQIHCDAGTYVAVPGIVGYTRLEYIESTGTQYINTGVRAVDSTITEVDFKLNKLEASVFGVLKSNGSNYYGLATTSNQWRLWYGSGGAPWVLGGTPDLDRHVAKIENKTLFLDGVSTLTSTLSTTSNINMYLFGANFEGSFYQPANARIYSAKIWSSGTLVRNMIPARRNSDGVVGMYDTVNNVFYTNAGTGPFIAGSGVGAIGGGECVNVGAGYYAAASTTNFGSVGTRNACPAGLTTVGYGHGADSANDCARVLHIDDKVLYARRDKITTPSLNIAVPNEGTYYVSLSPTDHTLSRLHFLYGSNKYTAYDDSLFYGERDFDTGQPITQ